MKTEVRKILSNLNDGRITVSQATEQVMYLVEQAQKEAYNQAIDQILKLMYDHEEEIYIGVFEDIEKLKK